MKIGRNEVPVQPVVITLESAAELNQFYAMTVRAQENKHRRWIRELQRQLAKFGAQDEEYGMSGEA
jgi:hypothetical protein